MINPAIIIIFNDVTSVIIIGYNIDYYFNDVSIPQIFENVLANHCIDSRSFLFVILTLLV